MKTRKKIILALLLIIVVAGIWVYPKYVKLNHTLHLFDEDRIVNNFRTFDSIWPFAVLTASPNPYIYQRASEIKLPAHFNFKGETFNPNDYLRDSWTTGFLVIQDDTIVFEKYYLGNTEITRTISWSMAKSFISALIGIAVHDGDITDISQNVEEYVPELIGSGYEGVRIKDVLEMRTGVRFNEDYADFNSDINRWGRGFALGNSQNDFAASLERETEPGIVRHYVSINTHVLGMVLTKATGKTITAYMQEKLYDPMGMEYNGYWVLDCENMEVALGGLNLTMKDFAKIGSLYLHNGYWNGKKIVSESWVNSSVTSDPNHHKSGRIGYGYQWWIPKGNAGEFLARGVYNQNIYVNPDTKTVIVKLSANPRFNDKTYAPSNDYAALELYRAIAASFAVEEEIDEKKLIVD